MDDLFTKSSDGFTRAFVSDAQAHISLPVETVTGARLDGTRLVTSFWVRNSDLPAIIDTLTEYLGKLRDFEAEECAQQEAEHAALVGV